MKDFERQIYFATSNRGKFQEARVVLGSFGIPVRMLRLDKMEIQSDNLGKIAEYAAEQAAELSGKSIFVEDAGLFVESLNGFPGPYSSYVYRKLGVGGILRLLKNNRNRKAIFVSVVSYCEPNQRPISFAGQVRGFVTMRAGGSGGFGFDPIFSVRSLHGRTFAQMPVEEKNKCSHRARALRGLARWLLRPSNHRPRTRNPLNRSGQRTTENLPRN